MAHLSSIIRVPRDMEVYYKNRVDRDGSYEQNNRISEMIYLSLSAYENVRRLSCRRKLVDLQFISFN
jgi:hypothetical protein